MQMPLIDDLNDRVCARINQHRVPVDYGISVISSARIFRRHFIVCHAAIREHATDTHVAVIVVRRIMTFSDIAMEARPVIDTQYAVDAAYNAADNTTNHSSDGTGIVLTDASAMIRTVRYALSIRSSGHGERYRTSEYDVSVHLYP